MFTYYSELIAHSELVSEDVKLDVCLIGITCYSELIAHSELVSEDVILDVCLTSVVRWSL